MSYIKVGVPYANYNTNNNGINIQILICWSAPSTGHKKQTEQNRAENEISIVDSR
jgi:hypothetical protein